MTILKTHWHPVAALDALEENKIYTAQLLDTPLVLWCSANEVVVMLDRCPHRGAALSLGKIVQHHNQTTLQCGYHGWQFLNDGTCTHQPAQPQHTPSAQACATRFESQVAYGLVWVKLQASNMALPAFPESTRTDLNQVLCGPYQVQAAAPRVVENFLDMAHFGFVHEGILGDAQHTKVADYTIENFDDARGQGIVALNCRAWQPLSNIKAAQGQWVDYTYRVNAPLTAILTKRPATQNVDEAIALFVQPQTEETSLAWIVLALSIWEQTAAQLRAFQDAIFAQDLKILESQTPKKMPLVAGQEVPQAADKMSAAYRRYLLEHKMDYGVLTHAIK